ncbi:ribonuclease HII [Bifidobacterium biavatii]|uniref:Ribonuclease n=1 Tax=Bifidobacterium biavatii DSM 23969 TaxID=1437608 RepID=A0A086ZT30_9BIFI|nr:ribonuclease HII [Bifidobacterium biavatii]KFI49680.1 ribonuclease HII [Bifidobacterium biavatii DSM 23969]
MSIQEIPTLRLERELADEGAELIVGFDEVGRGSLAGPVMVGAAMIRARDLPSLDVPDGVADSKMLTERRREAIYDELKSWCASWAVGSASNTEIDEWGISHALGVAALRALAEAERKLGLGTDGANGDQTAVRVAGILDGPNDYITKTLDTFDAPDVPAPARITTLVKADRHCATVATAAVIAKVTRDRLMVDLAQAHPEWAPYEWERNKGYGSAVHRAAIAELGPTPLHRVSWKLT